MHGVQYDAREIEASVRECVAAGHVCAIQPEHGGELTLILEAADADGPELARRVMGAVVDRHGLAPGTVCLVPGGELDGSGQPDGASGGAAPWRHEVLRRLRAGELTVAYRHEARTSGDRTAPSALGDSPTATAAGGGPVPGAAPTQAGPGLTAEVMRADVAQLLGIEPTDIDPDVDLVGLGLDSLRTMQLVNQWRRGGTDLTFAELAEAPVLNRWWELLAAAGTGAAEPAEVHPVDETAPFPLTPVQHAYWIGRRDDQVLGGVGCHFYVEFDGGGAGGTAPVDPDRLAEAVRALLRRHDLLRARFLDDGTQQIQPEPTWPGLVVHDLRAAGAAEVDAELAAARDKLAHRRLAVELGEVFDLRLSLLPGGRHRLHLNFDLLVADVLSIQLILTDLTRLYLDGPPADLPPLPYGFPTYLAHQESRRQQARERDRDYWRERLPDLPDGPQLPLAVEPALIETTRFQRRDHLLDRAARGRLEHLARQHGVTLPMVLATAYAEVLGAWSAEQRFLLNLPLFDREIVDPHVARLVADFTNLLPMDVDLRGPGSFGQRVHGLQEQLRAGIGHSAYTGVEVLRDLARTRPDDRIPAPVVFTSAIGMGDLVGEEVQRTFGRLGWMLSQTPQAWLDHQVTERDGGLYLVWDAVAELFPPGVLDDMFAGYLRLLDWLARGEWDEPSPALLPAAQAAVRRTANATGGPVPDRPLHADFFDLAGADPGRTALIATDRVVSYGDLADRSLRIAAALRDRGIGRGDVVGVTLPKGPEQIAAVLGVLAAGAAYLPAGPDQPPARRARMLRRAAVRVVLTDDDVAGWPDGVEPVPVATTAAREPLDGCVAVPMTDPAYVIFTSGSTGEPKGVEITHIAARNTVDDVNERLGVDRNDRVLAVSALDFDLSVYDIFGLLSVGGALVLVEEDERRDAYRWVELCRTHHVTVWNTVPALLDMLLLAAGDPDRPARTLPELRLVLVSGDWIGLDLPGRAATATGGGRFVALGGATEASIWSNHVEVAEVPAHWPSVPYGRPLRNQRYRVVDDQGRDRPDWVPGELWIGGLGVASGYRGDPEATEGSFLTVADARWYRTGDLGRYWPDGTLEFLGRTDHQVKVRGHRIELGEVEAALLAHPAVAAAVVLAVGQPTRLAATIVPRPEAAADDAEEGRPSVGGDELLAFLRERLPAHSVPASVTSVTELPLTSNGKVDRRALAARAGDAVAPAAVEPPRGEIEETVAAIWAELLGTTAVGRWDNFFALGGDSLLATRMISRLNAAGFAGADLGRLFRTAELASFAADLRHGGPERPTPTLRPDPEHRYDPFPLTDVQRAYWIGRTDTFALGGVGCHFYTEYDGAGIDLDRLTDAWNRVIERHEMLRAVFLPSGEQRILPSVPRFEIPVVEVGSGAAEEVLARQRDAMSHQVLDAGRWPLFDVRAVRYGDRTRLAVSIDSILIDALSAMILMREVDTFYRRPDAELPPVGVSFRDYVLDAGPDEGSRAESESYWSDRVDSLPEGPALPLARDPATMQRPRFLRREQQLPEPQWRRLRELAQRHGLTGSALLATAFAEVLGAWSARGDLTLNVTLFDRRDVHPDIDAVLGDFTSLLLVGYQPEPDESWLDAARRMQRRMGEDLAHSDVSAVWVMRELARRRGSLEVSMPVVFTSTLGVTDDVVVEPSFAERVWGVSQTPQVWLDHQVMERAGGLLLVWDAVEELFPAGVLDAMFAAYMRLLEWLAEGAWAEPVPALLPAEQRIVRADVNATAGPVPDGLLHTGFFRRAAESPERVALLSADGELTYGELAGQALRVAGALLGHGVRPGDLVGITLPKGPEQVAAVLGTLAAGAVYVPCGVDQPPLRRNRIFAGAGVRLVLTDTAARDWPETVRAVPLTDAVRATATAEPVPLSPDAPAYVIFTSGSTGEPKGVEITHAAAGNTVDDVNERFGVRETDRVLAVSALDFDLSVYDIFGLLAAGGALVLPAEQERREPQSWLRLCREHQVTLWNSVPALLDMLLVALSGDAPAPAPGLRLVLVSGDWVGVDLPGRAAAAFDGCRFVALGGATEAAIWSNAVEVTEVPESWTAVPYGLPLRNQRYRVVDDRGRDCPDWVAGELWIGGAGVATGYRNDPERTRERFVDYAGERWYRTGDLGRYWPDGTLEFLGRTDQQVKVRGHRIELGEVTAALAAHPALSTAAAVAVGRPPRLVAFGVTEVGCGDEDLAGLEEFVAARLPGYAVPGVCLVLDELPLTANGKVDRSALEKLADEDGGPAEPGEPPRGEVEEAVAAIWARLLDLPGVGREENFIALGGDSQLAARLAAALRERFGVDISLRQLFAAPTIAGTARLIDGFEEGAL
ncbi:amino acid adenylation domain-containing protein [Micromonospora sp. WMMD1128]|uniref:non-ribosomal peptide synthetase n=1 Tax=Micromonospora sp. WMMD1128 TaxID=3015150 RepID=UPI00248CD215|nr:non-ribosomal peptide synthetase [Micromonospora sp. WMMD1128]WBB73869.1 amino acid adenylation domain-containing protein [Micromonospora sp. WMMD1128]